MGISFFESMDGELRGRDGVARPFGFQLKAEASDLSAFLRTGETRISGVAHGPPWAEDAPLAGRLTIEPARGRRIAYDFTFDAPDGTPLRFAGEKTLRYLRPRRSLTVLPGRVTRPGDGALVAEGTVYFRIRTLPTFLASWRPWGGGPTGPRPAPAPDRVLDARGWATFDALVPAILAPGRVVPAPGSETALRAKRDLIQMPPDARAGVRAALLWLDAAALLRHRRPFHRLPVAARRDLVAALDDPARRALLPAGARAGLLQLAAFPIKAAHFSRRDYLDAIGHPPPRAIQPEPPPRHLRRMVTPGDLPSESTIEAEVVVVGTGAGGAALAASLARRGVAVAMVEAGRHHPRHHFHGRPADRMRALYRDAGLTVAYGTPVSIPTGRGVGGTTTINSGTCFPTPAGVLAAWRRDLGFPADFAPAAFRPYSDAVAAMLQVTPGRPEALGRIAGVIARGAESLGLGHGPLPRNAPECPGRGECVFGCPEGAKLSADLTWVPAALKAGATLHTGLRVTRILRRGARVVALEGEARDPGGGPPRRVRLRSERFVLATGTLATPLLLGDSGFRLPRLGRNLSVHPAIGLVARLDEDLAPWDAIPQGYAIHALEGEGVRYEGFYLPPELIAPQLPFYGARLAAWMDDFARLGQFGFMVRDPSVGRVLRGPRGRPAIFYRVTPDVQRRLRLGSALLAELFLAAGAREVLVPVGPGVIARTPGEARAIEALRTRFTDFRLLGAHPLGTCAMAASPDGGVVDFDHRVFGTENLHVVDGSVVPTSLGVNPQMTIMAMALRAADILAALLDGSAHQAPRLVAVG